MVFSINNTIWHIPEYAKVFHKLPEQDCSQIMINFPLYLGYIIPVRNSEYPS
jgi:hypothetical protein